MQKADDINLINVNPTRTLSREEIVEKLKSIKLLCLDMDGVLTDGGIIYDDNNVQTRNFNAKDGMGMVQLQRETGIPIAIVTGSQAPLIDFRFKDRIKCKYVYQNVGDKAQILKDICEQEGIKTSEVCHVGDDVNDLPMFAYAGLKLTVADAHKAIKERADFITELSGGKGAVREVCDLLMDSRNMSYTGQAF